MAINAQTLINQRIRERLKARAQARSTRPTRTISAAAKADPSTFAEEVGGYTVWSRQREVLTAARDHDRVSVRSGHKVSKSTSAAILCWWFTCDEVARPAARAIVTAPTGRQVSEIVWREVVAFHVRATARGYRLPVPGQRPGTGVRWGDGREVVGFTIDEQQPEAIAGFSGEHLLFVVDEASGVNDRVFEALDGNAAAGARFFFISNPTRTAGAFFDSQQPGSDYRALHISSEDSPNITGEAKIPGLATPAWRDRMLAKYGANSLFAAVRIRGEFPDAGDDEVLGAALVRAAMARTAEASGRLECGLDVAAFGGDENFLASRRGLCGLPLVRIEVGESHEVAGRALRALRGLRAGPGERPIVRIDANGVGFGVWSALVSDGFEFDGEVFRPREEVEAIAVNAGASAMESETYANLRAEMHFAFRDWLTSGASLHPDDELGEELRAPKYSLDRYGKILVEPKLKIRARLGRSPDRADASQLSVIPIYAPQAPAPPAPPPEDDARDLSGFAAR